jgi:RimJ/RimL family protein N-acetyltransferase
MAARETVTRGVWPLPGAHLSLRLERTALRPLRRDDAGSLVPLLRDADIQRFLPGAPDNDAAFQRFTTWSAQQRRRGGHLCLAITMDDRAIGLIQTWPLEPRGHSAEWGFALGRPYWGRGLFHEAARAFVSMAVSELGVERLEARSSVGNTRGMAALVRLGARPEGVLRRSVAVGPIRTDGVLWSILASEWTAAPPLRPSPLVAVR